MASPIHLKLSYVLTASGAIVLRAFLGKPLEAFLLELMAHLAHTAWKSQACTLTLAPSTEFKLGFGSFSLVLRNENGTLLARIPTSTAKSLDSCTLPKLSTATDAVTTSVAYEPVIGGTWDYSMPMGSIKIEVVAGAES